MPHPEPPRAHTDLLPLETLVAIFQEVTHDPTGLMQLALVCRNWREIVLGTSELWAHINIDFKSTLTESQLTKQLDLSLKASLMLDLGWDAPGALSKHVLEWNSPSPIRERVSSLRVRVGAKDDDEDSVGVSTDEDDNDSGCQSLFEGHNWPRLKKLVVDLPKGSPRMHLRAQNLERLDLSTDFRDWNYVGLGSALRDVRWFTDPEPSSETVADFFHVISNCINLRHLGMGAGELNLPIPFMVKDAYIWPNLSQLFMQFSEAAFADVLAIIVNAPRLTILCLWFTSRMVQSGHRIPLDTKFPPGLRELAIIFETDSDDRNEPLLRSGLLKSVVSIFDPAALEKIQLNGMPIIRREISALCPRVQEILPVGITELRDLMETLGGCPLVQNFKAHCYGVLEPSMAVDDQVLRTGILELGGDTFSETYAHLRTLELSNVMMCPRFIEHLAQYPQLTKIDLELLVLPETTSPDIVEVDWPVIGEIASFPELRSLTIDREITDNPHREFMPSTVLTQYMIAVAMRWACNMPSGEIFLPLAPLQVEDVAQFFAQIPITTLDRLKFGFGAGRADPRTFRMDFTADVVGNSLPPGAKPERFQLTAGVKRIDIADVADVILSRFPLDTDISGVAMDTEALDVIRMASQEDPGAAGLKSLLRRAGFIESENAAYLKVFGDTRVFLLRQ